MMGLAVDDYVTSGTGTLDEVMERGFSHEWGAFPANRELVRWMRAYNDVLGEVTPAPRVSPWYGYSPLDPAHLAGTDGIVFVKDAGARLRPGR